MYFLQTNQIGEASPKVVFYKSSPEDEYFQKIHKKLYCIPILPAEPLIFQIKEVLIF